MKQLFLFFIMGLLWIPTNWAQSTAINYQGTARDATNTLLREQQISIQISVLEGSANGTSVYVENHTATTSQTGLFTVAIGRGTVIAGNYEAIQWGGSAHFVNVGLDPFGGTNFSSLGQVELLSVPYALYAHSFGTLGEDGEQGTQGEEGIQGPEGEPGPLGPEGEQGDRGLSGSGGGKGARGPAGLSTVLMKNKLPNEPMENDVYLDDGSNRADGLPGFRYFNGTSWIDL